MLILWNVLILIFFNLYDVSKEEKKKKLEYIVITINMIVKS